MILWPTDPQVQRAFDDAFNEIESRPLGTRADVVAALLAAIPSIDFSYGEENEAYAPIGVYFMLHGDPVTGVSVTDADSDVYERLAALAATRGWALFADEDGSRL